MEFMKAYRDYRELLADAGNVTDHDEMIRLNRIRQTPESVRRVLEQRCAYLAKEIVEIEKERDELLEFLNGEVLIP